MPIDWSRGYTVFNSPFRRIVLGLLLSLLGAVPLQSQSVQAPRPAPVRIEPGLEEAVNWKWWVEPSDEKDWGLQSPGIPRASPTAKPGTADAPTATAITRPDSYEVKRGDALSIIARKFGMTVVELKTVNGLTTDLIKVGQTLKIPTIEELEAMAPAPEEEPTVADEEADPTESPAEKTPVYYNFTRETKTVLLQSFLDRENFSTGPIDGYPGAMFDKAQALYLAAHGDVDRAEPLIDKAVSAIGEPFTRYTLKPEDFRFIAPPKALKGRGKAGVEPPPMSYEGLIAQSYLAYLTPWEFVAERFHCAEKLLRTLNDELEGIPQAGTEFKVPNVIPFEIEKAFETPLQPAADPAKAVTAAIVDLNRLEIFLEGKLVAVFPMSVARPGLRGRGSWVILDATPRPRLVTRAEPKEGAEPEPVSPSPSPSPSESSTPGTDNVPRAKPVAATEQDLAAGPNNPLGIVWINLAKSDSTDPLPYGLHGTSIPGRMNSQESIGGLRLANWDIIRAVRMLPPGTPLQWK